jgi:hypothetical protein
VEQLRAVHRLNRVGDPHVLPVEEVRGRVNPRRDVAADRLSNPIERIAVLIDHASVRIDLSASGVIPDCAWRDPIYCGGDAQGVERSSDDSAELDHGKRRYVSIPRTIVFGVGLYARSQLGSTVL